MGHRMARGARIRAPYVAVALVIVVGLAGALLLFVGRGSSANTGRHVAQTTGANPSESAQMVCAPEAQKDIGSALGVTATGVTEPTWVDHLYSCRYVYLDGSMALSVKELASRADTTAYFDSLRSQLGEAERLNGVAQGAFTTSNGSLVLRKDYKVLLVDTSALPAPFGSGFKTRDQAAVVTGETVLGCWTGA